MNATIIEKHTQFIIQKKLKEAEAIEKQAQEDQQKESEGVQVARINPRSYLSHSYSLKKLPITPNEESDFLKTKRTSSSTLNDEQEPMKFTPMLRASRRPSQQPIQTIKERSASHIVRLDDTLSLVHDRIRGGLVDSKSIALFKSFVDVPKDNIFDSKVNATIYIAKMTLIIQDLLLDDVKQREQLARLKPNGAINDAMVSLAAKGIVDQ